MLFTLFMIFSGDRDTGERQPLLAEYRKLPNYQETHLSQQEVTEIDLKETIVDHTRDMIDRELDGINKTLWWRNFYNKGQFLMGGFALVVSGINASDQVWMQWKKTPENTSSLIQMLMGPTTLFTMAGGIFSRYILGGYESDINKSDVLIAKRLRDETLNLKDKKKLCVEVRKLFLNKLSLNDQELFPETSKAFSDVFLQADMPSLVRTMKPNTALAFNRTPYSKKNFLREEKVESISRWRHLLGLSWKRRSVKDIGEMV